MNAAAVAAFARLGELELYYETQGTGPPLVLIHGSLMTADLMNERLRAFRGRAAL
jgi:pimeloyl-ACP methyl ester carboxylesterase